MKTIVSITPCKLQEDSRTFRHAVSFARFGYKSIVVEGQASSDLNKAALPFELITMGAATKSDSKPVELDHDQLVGQTESMSGNNRSILDHIYDFVKSKYDLFPEPLKLLYRLPVRCIKFPGRIGWVRFQHYRRNFMRTNFVAPLRYLPKASLYYLHSPIYFLAVGSLCNRYGVPFIYDAHDFYSGIEEKENLSPFHRRWANPFLFTLEESCVERAAAVVTVCDGVARLQEETFNCQPVVARNCEDCRLHQTPRIDLRQSLCLSADDFLLVTIGTAKPGQAIEESLDAMRKLPNNVHLTFMGKNTDQHLDLIRQRELEGRVHTVPPVMPFEVVPFVRSADASLILYYPKSPNYENCLPNALFQAIGAELPLLYPELPEINRIAKDYGLGMPIDPLVPDSIRSGVFQLMSNPERLSTYRKNLREAKENLSWEREEGILRELLSKVLTEHSLQE